jgi:hypothetical protein
MYAAIGAKRANIVNGVTDAEGAPAAGAGAVKGIPKFWLTALLNHSLMANFIEEHDKPVLEYLTDITTDYLPGFKVSLGKIVFNAFFFLLLLNLLMNFSFFF